MKRIVVVQARTDSSRLASKCFGQIGEHRVIDHVLQRALAIPSVDRVFLATTNRSADDLLEHEVSNFIADGLEVYRGSVNDVQSRFLAISEAVGPCLVGRITADDPFKDPQWYAHAFNHLESSELDYVSLGEQVFPLGMDVEVFSSKSLIESRSKRIDAYSIEHVTPTLRDPRRFRQGVLKIEEWEGSPPRLTVDFLADLIFAARVGTEIQQLGGSFGYSVTYKATQTVVSDGLLR